MLMLSVYQLLMLSVSILIITIYWYLTFGVNYNLHMGVLAESEVNALTYMIMYMHIQIHDCIILSIIGREKESLFSYLQVNFPSTFFSLYSWSVPDGSIDPEDNGPTPGGCEEGIVECPTPCIGEGGLSQWKRKHGLLVGLLHIFNPQDLLYTFKNQVTNLTNKSLG